MKKCPHCKEENQLDAVVCRLCNKDFVESKDGLRIVYELATKEHKATIIKAVILIALSLPMILFGIGWDNEILLTIGYLFLFVSIIGLIISKIRIAIIINKLDRNNMDVQVLEENKQANSPAIGVYDTKLKIGDGIRFGFGFGLGVFIWLFISGTIFFIILFFLLEKLASNISLF